jgi:NodT family efflux transporter outer membrane factor (OMF) lipoprotein
LRTLQQRIVLAQAEVARQQRAVEIVGARVRGGLVTGEDLTQQRSSLASAQAAIEPLRAQAEVRIHALGVLVGTTPETLTALLAQAEPLPRIPDVPAGLPSDLLRRRPDIRAAERNLAAATADIGVATADLYPRFSLTAAPALVSTALGSLLEWGSRAFTAGGAVNWPLFNGGRTKANIAVTNARQGQELIAYRKAILVALQDVEDALSNVDGDRGQLAQLDEAVAASRRAEDLARTRYRGGLVTYSDVLQAQAGRIALESQVTETKGMLARHTVALTKALGGGWPELAHGAAQ